MLGIGMSLIIFISVAIYNKNDKIKQLKEIYEATLNGDDREKARAAGIAYYQCLRGGELTAKDEQFIRREIAHLPEKEIPDSI